MKTDKEKIDNYLTQDGKVDWPRLVGKTIVYFGHLYYKGDSSTRDILELKLEDYFIDDSNRIYLKGYSWEPEIYKNDILFVYSEIKETPYANRVYYSYTSSPPIDAPNFPPTWTGDPPVDMSPTVTCCGGNCGCSNKTK